MSEKHPEQMNSRDNQHRLHKNQQRSNYNVITEIYSIYKKW